MGKVVLEKIVLKNWHAFEDNEFNVSNLSTLITGMNASGKTTLLDAISIILDGANSNDFNVAVKDEGERRTISGALHYVISGEPTRTGKVTGLILAQFYDESYNTRFMNGVYLISKSYSSDSSIDQRFFSVINMSVDSPDFEVDFEKCKIPGQINYPNKKTAFEEFFRLRKMQHIKPEVYKGLINSVLRAKLNCSPAEFVRNNILPEDDKVSSVESIKNNYKLLDDREKLYAEISEEAEYLKKIRSDWFELKNGESDYAVLALTKQKFAKNELKALYNEKDSFEKSIIDIKIEKSQLEESLSGLNVKYGEYKSSDIALEKKKEQTILNRELLTLKTEMDRISKCISSMNELAAKVNVKRKYTKESSDSDVNTLLDSAEKLIDNLDENILGLREKNQRVKKEISDANENLLELRNGKFVSTNTSGIGARISAAKELAQNINDYFTKNNIDDVAAPLYELIDSVADATWQPAIEMLLGNKKISIVVKPENEKTAVAIQNKISLKSDTDIILSSKLKEVSPLHRSVVSQLSTKSKTARSILNAYYGSYVLCEDIDEYNQHDYALMKSGMSKNKVSSHKAGNPAKGDQLLIGGNSIKESIAETEKNLSILKKLDHEAVTEINRSVNLKKNINKLITEIKSCLPIHTEVVEEYTKKQNQLIEVKKEIEELLKTSKSSMTDKIKLEIKETKAKISSISKSYDAAASHKNTLTDKINQLIKLISDFEKQLEIIETGSITEDQVEECALKLKDEGKTLDEITKKQTAILNKGKTVSNKIKLSQTEYNMKFHKSFKVGLEEDTYSTYAKRLLYLEGKAFIEITREIQKLKNALMESKDGVFKGIAESFKFAMNEVEKINAILKLYDISGNRFKIHLGPSARRKDLYKAITMFANEESVPANILEQLDECFDKMINSKDANTFSELADYRNYLDCDVMISHVDKKVWKSFSNEKGSFSGGQKETPYYMCLAAALSSKAYTTGGFRLIVLDEAFKNMDQINKVKALSMFQNLNLQTLLFTSNSDLVSYIDNIYVITKFEDRIVTAFGKNKESLSVVDKRIKVSA
jgi:uncharacterized protein YPO0396